MYTPKINCFTLIFLIKIEKNSLTILRSHLQFKRVSFNMYVHKMHFTILKLFVFTFAEVCQHKKHLVLTAFLNTKEKIYQDNIKMNKPNMVPAFKNIALSGILTVQALSIKQLKYYYVLNKQVYSRCIVKATTVRRSMINTIFGNLLVKVIRGSK